MNNPVQNVVFVHGAFADGSCWLETMEILRRQNYQATAVQLPLTSLAADVAATKRAISMQKGPMILVGHSYGGTVISEAGISPDVAGLVYLAALVPETGEVYSGLASTFPSSPGGAHIQVNDGFAQLSEEGFVQNFAQDVPQDRARLLASVQKPVEMSLFDQKTQNAAWKEKPSAYVLAKQDRMVHPELQGFYAKRAQAKLVEVDSSHALPLSQPRLIADLIIEAANAYKKAA